MAVAWSKEIIAPLRAVAEIINDGDLDKATGATALTISANIRVDGPFMDRVGPQLKVLARSGIGLDNIDISAATERGILVCHTPDAPSESTAEHTVALLLAVAKRIVAGDMKLRGADVSPPELVGTEALGRTLGVVGYGRIGRRVAEICALGLKMRVLVYDPFIKTNHPPSARITLVDKLDTILSEADFVSLHTPLTKETRHLIGARELSMMKQGSYLINASRGPVVDERALIKVLQAGRLAGAGLDVFDPEPPEPDNPLLQMRNVVITPHIASSTNAGRLAMFNGVVDQVLQVLRGERPTYLANPDAWPGRLEIRS
jgi:D-3-phosphoglycerate dehydrogenase